MILAKIAKQPITQQIKRFKIQKCMKFYFKISVVFWFSLFLGAYSISATPMHYNLDHKADIQKPIIQQSILNHEKKAEKRKGKWFNFSLKKKKHTSPKRSSKQQKRAKRKLLWTLFKNQFKSKKKRKEGDLQVEFWSLASLLMAFWAVMTFLAGIFSFAQAGLVTGIIFYAILGAISFLFAKWGRQNIKLYPGYYKGKNLTKWAKWISLSPIIALLVTLMIILLTIF